MESIKESVCKGNTYFIFVTDKKSGKGFHLVGCVLFSANKSGIWINWLAINRKHYLKLSFGVESPDIPFQKSGLGKSLATFVGVDG